MLSIQRFGYSVSQYQTRIIEPRSPIEGTCLFAMVGEAVVGPSSLHQDCTHESDTNKVVGDNARPNTNGNLFWR